jgi:hypothetical protein
MLQRWVKDSSEDISNIVYMVSMLWSEDYFITTRTEEEYGAEPFD